MEDWNADSIQGVWFVTVMPSIAASTMFEHLVGALPEASQQNTRLTPSSPFLSTANGPWGAVHVAATTQPTRLDLHITGPQDDLGVGGLLPPGSLLPLLDSFLPFAVKIASELPFVNRMALVVNLSRPAESFAASAKVLDALVGPFLPFDDPRDYNVQVSRRRLMGWDNSIEINRLLRFATGLQQELQIDPIAGIAIPTEGRLVSSRLIDVNVVPTQRIYTTDEQQKMWPEIVIEMKRLLQNGSLRSLADG